MDMLGFAARNYALALAIDADPTVATAEAKRIHDELRWSNLAQWREAVAREANDLHRKARTIVAGGKGAAYTVRVRRSFTDKTPVVVTMGCCLVSNGRGPYLPLFTSDDPPGLWK